MQSNTSEFDLLFVILTESPPENVVVRSSCAKILAASLFRRQFEGTVWLLTSRDHQLFRVTRPDFNQFHVPLSHPDSRGYWAQRDSVGERLKSAIADSPDCYVVVSDAAGVALRGVEHLILASNKSVFNSPMIDLFWAEGCRNSDSPNHPVASPGLWAVRGEHFESLLRKWSEKAYTHGGEKSETEIWSEVVGESPLKKRRFEKGEVYAPRINTVDWEAVSNAAFVTVPDWPEKEQWKFLQALYFGTYFGDETGMMLNILDA